MIVEGICLRKVPQGMYLHDFPETPPCFGMYVCPCEKCTLSLEASWRGDYPRLEVIVKLSRSRHSITGGRYVEIMRTDGSQGLLWGRPNEYVREVFVKQMGSASCQCETRQFCSKNENRKVF